MNLESLLPASWAPADYLTLLVGITAFFTIVAVWNTAIARDPMRGRIKALAERREAMRAGFVAPQRRERRTQREKSVGIMRQVVKRMNLMRNQSSQKIVQKMASAGWRSKDSIVIYLFFKLILPILVGVGAVIVLFGLKAFDLQPLARTGAAKFTRDPAAPIKRDHLVRGRVHNVTQLVRGAIGQRCRPL